MAQIIDINIKYKISPLCSYAPSPNVEEIPPQSNVTTSVPNPISVQPPAADVVPMDVEEEVHNREIETVVAVEINDPPTKVVRRSSRRHKENPQALEKAGSQNYISMLENVEWLNETLVQNPLFFTQNKVTAVNMRTAARSLQLKSSGKKDDLAGRLSQYGRALRS